MYIYIYIYMYVYIFVHICEFLCAAVYPPCCRASTSTCISSMSAASKACQQRVPPCCSVSTSTCRYICEFLLAAVYPPPHTFPHMHVCIYRYYFYIRSAYVASYLAAYASACPPSCVPPDEQVSLTDTPHTLAHA